MQDQLHSETLTTASLREWALGKDRCLAVYHAVTQITNTVREALLAGTHGLYDLRVTGLVVTLDPLFASPPSQFSLADGGDPNVADLDRAMADAIYMKFDHLIRLVSATKNAEYGWDVHITVLAYQGVN